MAANEPVELPDSERALLAKTDFKAVTLTKDLPVPVITILGLKENPYRMAEPEQSWSAGCTGGPKSPRERFKFGGTTAERCFVYFERGGIAHFYVLQFYKLADGKATLVHQSMSNKEYKSADDIKKALGKKEIQ